MVRRRVLYFPSFDDKRGHQTGIGLRCYPTIFNPKVPNSLQLILPREGGRDTAIKKFCNDPFDSFIRLKNIAVFYGDRASPCGHPSKKNVQACRGGDTSNARDPGLMECGMNACSDANVNILVKEHNSIKIPDSLVLPFCDEGDEFRC